MKSICLRIISVIAPISLGVAGATITPSVSAAASVQPFEGTFSSGKVTLQLQYDTGASRYVGVLRVANDLLPVSGTGSATSFTGQYIRNTRVTPISATITGDVVRLVYDRSTESLRRVDTSASPSSTVAAGSPPAAPSGAGRQANQSAASALVTPPRANAGTGGVLKPIPKVGGKAAQLATVAQAGMRLTFFLGSSTTQTGAVPVNPNDVTGSASAGYIQVNVLDVSNGQASTEVRQYIPDTSLNNLYAVTSTTAVVSADNGGEGYWRSPAALAAMKDQAKGDETIARLSYPLEGKNYNAIRITTKTATATTQTTYDLDSGVLLSYGFNGTGANGSAQVVQMLLKNARQLKLPWIGQRATADVTGLNRMSFSGQYVSSVDNSYSQTSPMTQDWDITKVGVASVQFAQTTTVTIGANAPAPTKVNQVYPLSGVWLNPKILATLRSGQVLDDDPITRGQLKVWGAQNGTMAIGEQNAIQAGVSAYDLKTGVITAFQTQLRTGLGSTTIFLQRTR